MVHEFHADLHVHTCLSPCGELSMSPAGIVETALAEGINILAVCDHNSARNVEYVQRAAENSGLVVIPGMEVCSREEVHILTLFETLNEALAMQDVVYSHLDGKNDEDAFGLQVVANELGEVEAFEEKLLIGATTLSVDEVAEHAHRIGGLVIPAHIDRESFSMIGQLGFLPLGYPADALEVSWRTTAAKARESIPGTDGYTLVTSSDAHDLAQIGKAFTRFHLKTRSFSEIRKALKGEGERRVETI